MILPTYDPSAQAEINRIIDEKLSELYGIHGQFHARRTIVAPEATVSDNVVVLSQIGGATYVPTTRNVLAGAGLTGGGDLSADRTFNVGVGTGVTITADTVSVNEGADFAWTGAHSFTDAPTTADVPAANTDLTNKLYVDTAVAGVVEVISVFLLMGG